MTDLKKAQITLHIPIAEEMQLRKEYMAQPAGRRGRFSEFVYQFIVAGREHSIKAAHEQRKKASP